MLKTAILGASGYTGLELLRILANHPEAEVVKATSRQYKGISVSAAFPFLKGFYDGLTFSDPAEYKDIGADVVFCALPHGSSQEVVPEILDSGAKVIDLSADFRLKDETTYIEWYGVHKAPELIEKAVYGLPELNRKEIKKAALIANPGCYPTSAILALAPLAAKKLLQQDAIIIDSKSGASGAGRQASVETSFTEVYGGFKAYKVGCHRHTPEIEQGISGVLGKKTTAVFTPHLLPVSRGILTTAYAKLKKGITTEEALALFEKFYAGEPFVRVMSEGKFPDISGVRGSNFCDIGIYADKAKKLVIAVSAIDNLVKGASGQAVQNMNIMCGFEETMGLTTTAMAY